MGTGNKLRENFIAGDIFDSEVCPLAKVMRRELRKRGVPALKAVYGKTTPAPPAVTDGGKSVVGSISYIPAKAGLLITEEVIISILNAQRVINDKDKQ